jgi:hypothetical protein
MTMTRLLVCSPLRRFPLRCRLLGARSLGALALWFGVSSLTFGCKETGGAARTESTTATPGAEPERFNFNLPSEYTSLELSGEGSELLRAPPGASARREDAKTSVTAGPDFALDVSADPPPLAELSRSAGAGERVLEERDLVIFKSPAGYAFVMVRELVPEWDENQPQRFACASRGAALGGSAARADMPRFSRNAVQNMVAACRTLQLPKLE